MRIHKYTGIHIHVHMRATKHRTSEREKEFVWIGVGVCVCVCVCVCLCVCVCVCNTKQTLQSHTTDWDCEMTVRKNARLLAIYLAIHKHSTSIVCMPPSRSQLIWANRPSNKGTRLLLQVQKAIVVLQVKTGACYYQLVCYLPAPHNARLHEHRVPILLFAISIWSLNVYDCSCAQHPGYL